MKKVMVTRLGAFGDAVMVSMLFRLLKKQGYYTVANVSTRSEIVLRNNPYVDEWLIHKDNSVPVETLHEHWKKITEGFDKHINLTGSIEEGLLISPHNKEIYEANHMIRHLKCDRNYYDKTLEIAGFEERGLNGELYFSQEEENWGKKIREQHKNRFIILWSLAGSSPHKAYPYAEIVANQFLSKHKDVVIYTVGDSICVLLEFLDQEKVDRLTENDKNAQFERNWLVKNCSHERVKHRSGLWNIRRSLVMTKYADCVIGTETGVLNAAGCFETPKVILLSHSSHKNLSKHWKNCYPIEAKNSECPCHPCHKMIYKGDVCMKNSVLDYPMCMAHIPPERVLEALEDIYTKKGEKTNGLLCESRR